MSHQQLGHTETGPRFKVSSEAGKRGGGGGGYLAIPGLVVQRVIQYTTVLELANLQ